MLDSTASPSASEGGAHGHGKRLTMTYVQRTRTILLFVCFSVTLGGYRPACKYGRDCYRFDLSQQNLSQIEFLIVIL